VAFFLIVEVVVPGTIHAADHPITLAELNRALERRVLEFLGSMGSGLEISARDGVVTIRGVVNSAAKRNLIEQRAAEIAGQKLDNQTRILVNN
jgi:hypothetical protein